jgi:hypothetical protein
VWKTLEWFCGGNRPKEGVSFIALFSDGGFQGAASVISGEKQCSFSF